MRGTAELLVSLTLVLWPISGSAEDNHAQFSVQRFMLAAGTNDGGLSRVELRYAVSDAKAISKVFQELGGVDPEDQILLNSPNRDEFWDGFNEISARIFRARPLNNRLELFVYYSGHSDERGLLLGGETISYGDLRAAIDAVPADVRVIILDSCASGVLTRLKGGARRKPFLVDESAQMKGHAFLTSSSDDESAQESDRIQASFFTHSLVSGLRGAADVTQDKRITLNEAYQFAFYETMARTEGTQSGTQHPAYDIQMVGAGDLVMTDLRGTSAGLVLEEEITGRLRVRDADNALVIELQKPPGRLVELGLEPGDYRVILEREGDYYGSELCLTDGCHTALRARDFNYMTTELTTARGGQFQPPSISTPESAPYLRSDFSVSLWPGSSTISPNEDRTISTVSLNLTVGRSAGVRGVELGGLANWSLGDVAGVQLAYGVNVVEGSVEGVQVVALLNRVRKDMRYVQLSGLVNATGGLVEGIQMAGLLNVAERSATSIQWAGVLNVTAENQVGGQVSGVCNYIGGNLEGIQASSAGNVTTSHLDGVQMSGGFNSARSLRGVQLGIINVAGTAVGGQFGIVNVAQHVMGTQIGVVNFAEDVVGAPVGLVSLVQRGQHHAAVWGSDTADLNLGVKLGNRHVYSMFMLGTQELSNSDRLFAGFGLGVHIPQQDLFVTMETMTMGIRENGSWPDDLHMLHKGRIGIGWRLAPRFSIVGGGIVNVYTSRLNNGADFAKGTWYRGKEDDTWVRVWPGFFFGFQI